jgi:hypothetical protein
MQPRVHELMMNPLVSESTLRAMPIISAPGLVEGKLLETTKIWVPLDGSGLWYEAENDEALVQCRLVAAKPVVLLSEEEEKRRLGYTRGKLSEKEVHTRTGYTIAGQSEGEEKRCLWRASGRAHGRWARGVGNEGLPTSTSPRHPGLPL